MKKGWKVLISLLIIFTFCFLGISFASNNVDMPLKSKKVLIKYKKDMNDDSSKIKSQNNGQIRKLGLKGLYALEVDSEALESLKADPDVELVEDDGEVKISSEEISWNLEKVNAGKLQEKNYFGKGIKVAVFDTGIDVGNNDLNISGGISFVEGAESYNDDNGHGTAVAGILSAIKNNDGLIGVAPEVELYSVKVLDKTGRGTYSNIINGLQWAIENNIGIIVMSFGGPQYSKILKDAISEVYNEGILIIAASGNGGSNVIDYPANYGDVICVGAIDKNNNAASFSNSGCEMDIVAPGVMIETTGLNNATLTIDGTSAAVPHVAGIAAQLWEARKELSNKELKALLYKSATPLGERESYGWGIVNGFQGLEDINTELILPNKEEPWAEIIREDVGENGIVYISYKYPGYDNQHIDPGDSVTVRAGFYDFHSRCIATTYNTSDPSDILHEEIREPISGNAYMTYTCPEGILNDPGTYKIRYHAEDDDNPSWNSDGRWDDVFTVYVDGSDPDPDPEPEPDPEDDYGDYPDDAKSISAGSWKSGEINYEGDIDFFKFTTTAAGNYKIESSGETDVLGILYNSNEDEIASDDDGAGMPNFRIEKTLSANRTYYISVQHYNDSDTGAYEIKVTPPIVVTADQYEPNNSMADANSKSALSFNQDYYATIHVNSDVDWYRIEVPSGGGRVTVTLQNIPSGKNYNVELYDGHSDYNCERGGYNTGNTSESFTQDVEQGRYYVRVYPYNSVYSDSVNTYKLRISLHQHTWGSWVNTGDGYNHRRTCTVCGATEIKPHNWSEWTYMDKTVHRHTCDQCNASKIEEHSVNNTTGKCDICDGTIFARTIVIVHGTTGSSLEITHEHSGDGIVTHNVWLPHDPFDIGHDMRLLECDAYGDSLYENIIAKDPEDNGVFNLVYGKLRDRLIDAGFDVHVFTYDWRLDNTYNAQLLEDFIEDIGESKVSIVAHSMGGILSAEYINNGNSEKVDKLVTLGTPYLGAPKALYVYETGKFFDNPLDWKAAPYFKELCPNMLSTYQLLPTENYFNYNDTFYLQKYYDNPWYQRDTKANVESYDDTIDSFESREWYNSRLMSRSESLHSNLDILDTLDMVDSYFIIGDAQPTIGELRYKYKKSGDTYSFDECDDIFFINGDGTVPVISANIGPNADADKLYYVNASHLNLARSIEVSLQVINILNNKPALVGSFHSEPKGQYYTKITVDCPVELHLYDSSGNHVGPIDGDIEENIEGVQYFIFGDKKIAVFNNADYSIRLVGTDNGLMDYTLEKFNAQNMLEQVIKYEDVSLTEQTSIATGTSNHDINSIHVDYNRDGREDYIINPSSTLDEVTSKDIISPTLIINTEGVEGSNDWYKSDVLVSGIANDENSGISKVEYMLNESQVYKYESPITVSAEGVNYVYFVPYDNNGNHPDAIMKEIKIDKTSPEIGADIESKEWTNSDVSIKPAINDSYSGISSVEYSWSLSEGTPVTFEHLVNESVVQNQPGIWYLHINAQDNVGNMSSKCFGPYKIDKTAPTVRVAPENRDWDNTDISTVPIFEDEGGSQVAIKQYFWSKEEATPSQWNECSTETISHDIDGIWYLHLRVVDVAGNETVSKYGVYKLDKSEPTTKAVPVGREWSSTEVSVQAEYNDIGGSELLEMQYCWSTDESAPSDWVDYTGIEMIQTEEGSWYLYLRASDNAGNITVEKYGPYQIDRTAPVISVSIGSRDWSNTNIAVEPSYTDDNGSGISKALYSWSMDESAPEQWNSYNDGDVVQAEEGIWYLHLKAVDKAGNETTAMYGPYKTDKTAPQTSASIEERDWEVSDVEVIPGYTDEGGSELDKLQYAWSLTEEAPSQWEDYSSDGIIQQEDGVWYLYLRAVDNAGNETVNRYGQYKVDKTAPEIKADPSEVDWVNRDIAVNPEITDMLSGVAGMSYIWSDSEAEPEEWLEYNGGELSVADTGLWYLHLRASDNVGNERIITFGPYRIDKIIPSVEADPESMEWTNQDAIVIPAYNDEGGSQLGTTQYYWSEDENNPGTWEDNDGSGIIQSKDGIWYLFLKAVDRALNEITSMFGPYKVDQTVPEIVYGFNDEYFYGDTIILEFDASDSLSGISETYVNFYGERYENGEEAVLDRPGVHEIEMIAVDIAGNERKEIKEIEIIVPADIDIDPDVINLKNLDKGNGDVTVYIEFPDDLSVSDIELDTILMNDEVVPVTDDKYGYVENPVSDYDDDGIDEFMVKFERDSLVDILVEGDNDITISGRAGDYRFIGYGILEVKSPGKNKQ